MLKNFRLKHPGLPSSMLPLIPQQTQLRPPAAARRQTSNAVALARLPVPDLKQTLQRYVTSLQPFLLEAETRTGAAYANALAERQKWADDFENGLGQTLQARLQALDENSPNNWLDDNIWLKKAYHEWRAPLLVNSNWWLAFKNDPSIPHSVYLGLGTNPKIASTGVTRWQVRRAAWLIYRVLDFKARLEKQDIYPEASKTGIWFRTSTEKIFNIARLPRSNCDTFSHPQPPHASAARKVICTVRDWFYAIEVVDERGQIIHPKGLENRILEVVLDVGKRLQDGDEAVPISVLTAGHRDAWTENQAHLLSLSPTNGRILDAINNSLMGLSLDHYTYVLPAAYAFPSPPLPIPDTPEEVDAHLHNLRSSHPSHPGRNRWHDKPFTLIVESNGRAGAEGEHSPVDALVPSIVADYAVVQAIDEDAFDGPFAEGSAETPPATTSGGWERLDWAVDDQIRGECIVAEEKLRQIVQDSDHSVLWFDSYGTDWIHNQARLSTDGYIQMAMQLAWYRTQGSFTATYETALTRMFKNGRTETIRTLTADSREWVLAMMKPDTPVHVLHSLLRRAIQTHSGLTRAAMTGRGIDRHLLGLRLMMQPEEGEHHELFDDLLFTDSQTWKLSTSALSAGDQFRGTGFGTPEHDGYGINYLAGPSVIKFGIESKHSCSLTSTQEFKAAISAALLDMREVCRSMPPAHL